MNSDWQILSYSENHSALSTYARLLSQNLGMPAYLDHPSHYYLNALHPRFIRKKTIVSNIYTWVIGPHISVIHDLGPIEYGSAFVSYYTGLILLKIRSPLVFVSKHTQKEFESYFYKKRKSTVIYPFIAPEFQPLERTREDYVLIDFNPKSGPRKNYPAYVKYIKEHPETTFYKLGGHFMEDLPNVHYFEHLDFKEINELYNRADRLLFLSLDEGFGSPLAQAMITKTPVEGLMDNEINREIYGDLNDTDVDRKYERILDLCNPQSLTSQWMEIMEGV